MLNDVTFERDYRPQSPVRINGQLTIFEGQPKRMVFHMTATLLPTPHSDASKSSHNSMVFQASQSMEEETAPVLEIHDQFVLDYRPASSEQVPDFVPQLSCSTTPDRFALINGVPPKWRPLNIGLINVGDEVAPSYGVQGKMAVGQACQIHLSVNVKVTEMIN